ncbi:MAG TPA: Wzz/FepE/Etk N-terminal domain-containing protein [Steroidobacteraceae bacterium]|nr:Wzz/FepE/Etk N-terminal domain-containing protein [Steroidobacteraceae bacterium]
MSDSSKEISLSDIGDAINRRRRVVLACTVCTLLIAAAYAIFATPKYDASAVVQPNSTQPMGGALAALAGQLGPVADLAGVNLGNKSDETASYLAVLSSRQLALKFISQYDAGPQLFPARWNARTRQWKPPGLLRTIKNGVSRALAALSDDKHWHPPTDAPTQWELIRKFQKLCTIKQDSATGLVAVTFSYEDPDVATKWADEYIALANSQIRNRAIAEANLALSYLKDESDKTSLADMKNSIYTLMQQRLGELIAAKSKPDYAFQVIDPAMTSDTPSSPQRGLVMLGGALIGFMGSSLWVLVREFSAGSRRKTTLVPALTDGRQ